VTFTVARWRAEAVQESWRLRFGPGSVHKGWERRARCLNMQTELFYGPGANRTGEMTCVGCPVRLDCLHDAFAAERGLSLDQIFGVFGGLCASERVERLRAVPELRDAEPRRGRTHRDVEQRLRAVG
jgi:hypothetical protein